MKKNVLVSLSVATLLSVGAVGVNEINGVANNTNVVQAAVKMASLLIMPIFIRVMAIVMARKY
ncbi:hypothetical protein AAA410_07470 [Lactobacillus crispatus]|uniref:hypothetical protein n=1 Tax=Lactobacillus crispatus TaxID=47770 RepID=UPI0030F70C4B